MLWWGSFGSYVRMHKWAFAPLSLNPFLNSTYPERHSAKIDFSPKDIILSTSVIVCLAYLVILLRVSPPLMYTFIYIYVARLLELEFQTWLTAQWLLWHSPCENGFVFAWRRCDVVHLVLVLGPGVRMRDEGNGGHGICSHLPSGLGWLS